MLPAFDRIFVERAARLALGVLALQRDDRLSQSALGDRRGALALLRLGLLWGRWLLLGRVRRPDALLLSPTHGAIRVVHLFVLHHHSKRALSVLAAVPRLALRLGPSCRWVLLQRRVGIHTALADLFLVYRF